MKRIFDRQPPLAMLCAGVGTLLAPCSGRDPSGAGQPKVYESGIVWEEPKQVTPVSTAARRRTPSSVRRQEHGRWSGGDKWILEDGAGTAKSAVSTKAGVRRLQLHVEFASPKRSRARARAAATTASASWGPLRGAVSTRGTPHLSRRHVRRLLQTASAAGRCLA